MSQDPLDATNRTASVSNETDWSRLKRPRHEMPDDIIRRLEERGLLESYRARPAYQQNDYIGWITCAKRPQTREKRLSQMLDELTQGDIYMNMAWSGVSKVR